MTVVTLSATGYGTPFVVHKGENAEDIYIRQRQGGYQSAGVTRSGGIKLLRDTFKPRFICAFSDIATQAEAATLQYFFALKEDNPTQQFVLKDEYYYVDVLETAWHNRQVISGSSISVGGRTQSFVQFNVLLGVPDGDSPIITLGGRKDWYRYRFIAEEII